MNEIKLENLDIDKNNILKCLSLFAKSKSISENIFSIHYEEKQEVGFLIPQLVLILSKNFENITKYILINDFLPISSLLINRLWIGSTNGGKVQFSENRIVFKLAGFKQLDNVNNPLVGFFDSTVSMDNTEIEKYIQENLKKWDSKKIIVFRKFFDHLWDTFSPLLQASKNIEINIDPVFPILKFPEITFSCFLMCTILPFFLDKIQSVGILNINYDAKSKMLITETVMKTKNTFEYPQYAENTFKYFVEQLDGNISINIKETKSDFTYMATAHIPDPIGIFLDNEIPGWDCFSYESKDILRRLGNELFLPYDHQFIHELLQHEIEIYSFNLFMSPLFQNLAYEILEKNKSKKKKNLEIENLLQQIRKGKLKKNLLEPKLVGLLLEFFLKHPNGAERIIRAYNMEKMTKKRLLEFSQLLKAFPQSTEEIIKILPQFLQNTAEPDNR
ncbi:MAG TPA: hypothetical protein PLX23_12095 [Candidatus Hydrogenedens sp.]|nr:hypothetical protein [Candidatus Hydrogenedens sp.]